MTDLPYTDEDLRAEAALCLRALGAPPTVADVMRWLPGAHVDSRRNEDRSGDTWDDLFDNIGLAEVARTIHGLLGGAADTSAWAVSLGADGLEPEDHTLSVDGDGKPLVRLHCAFHPDLDDAARTAFMLGLARALAEGI